MTLKDLIDLAGDRAIKIISKSRWSLHLGLQITIQPRPWTRISSYTK